jgi:hypothetical protein
MGQFLAIAGSSCVIVIMGLILLEYLTGFKWRMDRFLFPRQIESIAPGTPGRPSLQSTLAFLSLALALLGSVRKNKGMKFSRVVEGLTLMSGGVALMAFFGYAYSVDALFSVSHLRTIGMSPYTAAYVLLACVAALLAEPTSWTVKILSRTSTGGELARLLLPIFILVPLLLGLVRIEAERAGWFTHEIGTSLMALAQVFIGVGMLFWLVYTIDRAQVLEKFVTMSCVSKRILEDGEWIGIEQFLFDHYNIRISHGMTPEEAEAWLNEAREFIALEKKQSAIEG